MGMRQLEAEILAELRDVTRLRTLRQKDIMEWSTGDVKAGDGETVVRLPSLGMNVAYVAPVKKRKSAAAGGVPPEPPQQ